ncbi:MFS transporter [Umezawaea sp. Da 62-37]|uniref:MFS transporter n=1 Tax=Umezawaea sp. Da 62-37 TaxID=3075927 RepID=UPI0028F72053|nr:MFS transporter [Umezawaea sp. Da 62-37]WNV85226.1 MFS transporter [Umezawaea sp. Da 62-37]
MSGDTADDTRIGVVAALRATPGPVRYLLGGMLINQLGAFVQTFLVLYLTFRGSSVTTAGLCLVAYSVGSIFGSALGGELSGRLGPRGTIVAAMTLSAPTVAMIPLAARADALVLLLAVVALAGLATQTYRPAASVLLSELMPEKFRTMGFSMVRTALNVGAALAPLIAAGLILISWDLLFWLDAATAAGYALLAFKTLPKATARRDGDEPEEPATLIGPRQAYGVLLRDRRFLCFLGSIMIGSLLYVQSNITLPLQIHADGYPTGLYSIVLALSSVILITCELKLTTYIVRLPTHVAGLLGHLVISMGFAVYALTGHSPAFVIAGAVLYVTGLMMAGPSMYAHPATFPGPVKARYISTMDVASGFALAVGPVFGVFAWTWLHSGFWLLASALNVVAGLLAMIGLRRTAVEPESPAVAVTGHAETETVRGVA